MYTLHIQQHNQYTNTVFIDNGDDHELESDGDNDSEVMRKRNLEHNYSFAVSSKSEHEIMGRLAFESMDESMNNAASSPHLLPTAPTSPPYAPYAGHKDKSFSIPNDIKDSLRMQGGVGSVGILTNSCNDGGNDKYMTKYEYPKNFK